jgi:hypothetical protein
MDDWRLYANSRWKTKGKGKREKERERAVTVSLLTVPNAMLPFNLIDD